MPYNSKEKKKAHNEQYRNRLEVRERQQEYMKEYMKDYRNKPENKEKQKEYMREHMKAKRPPVAPTLMDVMTVREYHKMRYNQDYIASTTHRVRAAIHMLEKLGCTISYPPSDEFEAAIADYAANCQRRKRLDG